MTEYWEHAVEGGRPDITLERSQELNIATETGDRIRVWTTEGSRLRIELNGKRLSLANGPTERQRLSRARRRNRSEHQAYEQLELVKLWPQP